MDSRQEIFRQALKMEGDLNKSLDIILLRMRVMVMIALVCRYFVVPWNVHRVYE